MVDIYKLKKGDKVRFTNASLHKSHPRFYPKPGTIGIVQNDRYNFIQWPAGSTSRDDRWHANGSDLELVATGESTKIVIMVDKSDPMRVIAKELDSGKVADAKCSPYDTFDFMTGAKLAFARLCDEFALEPKCKFKVGDIIVGNEKANRYGITKKGWVGRVAEVFHEPREGIGCDRGKPVTFRAEKVNVCSKSEREYSLCDDAFDLA